MRSVRAFVQKTPSVWQIQTYPQRNRLSMLQSLLIIKTEEYVMDISLEQAHAISQSINIDGRKMEFNFELDEIPRTWVKDDVFTSSFLSALSCLFPEGERMFMDAVRDNLDKISDPQLLEQVKGF